MIRHANAARASAAPGGKPALAKLVYDITLAGDARPLPQSDRPEVQAIIDEPDPAQARPNICTLSARCARASLRPRPPHREQARGE
ncbi:hypothetical protein ACIBO5_52795 [Nonomuraea angiospora]|uniref:hypothetical protein n=1 Tax=Nonomuraea angiospora TaxID=46172 RepID=UPI0037AAD227